MVLSYAVAVVTDEAAQKKRKGRMPALCSDYCPLQASLRRRAQQKERLGRQTKQGHAVAWMAGLRMREESWVNRKSGQTRPRTSAKHSVVRSSTWKRGGGCTRNCSPSLRNSRQSWARFSTSTIGC